MCAGKADANRIAERIVHDPEHLIWDSTFVGVAVSNQGKVGLFSKAANVMHACISGGSFWSWTVKPESSANVASIAGDKKLSVILGKLAAKAGFKGGKFSLGCGWLLVFDLLVELRDFHWHYFR
jgi:hypothetical protein